MILTVMIVSSFFAITTVKAQQNIDNQVWHKGFLITTKRDTVKGKVRYDHKDNSIQVLGKKNIQSFSSHNILMSQIYDENAGINRRFYSMPFEINRGFKTKVLFELLYEGPLSLLSREEIIQEPVNNTSFYGTPVYRDRVRYSYFFLDDKGKIMSFNGKRSELLQLMGKKSNKIKTFIKENRLKSDQVRDLIRITAFYNSI